MNESESSVVGAPVSYHRISMKGIAQRFKPVVVVGTIVLFLGLGFLLLAVIRPPANTLVVGFLATLVGLSLFVYVFLAGLKSPAEVAVHEHGIRWADKHGTHEAGWIDIRNLYRSETLVNQTIRKAELKFEFDDGKCLVVDTRLSDYDQLADGVQRLHAQDWYGATREGFSRGESRFGPIALRQASIILDGTAISWSELHSCAVINGSLMFNVPGAMGEDAMSIALADVPNYSVLFMLLEEMGVVPVEPATFFQNSKLE